MKIIVSLEQAQYLPKNLNGAYVIWNFITGRISYIGKCFRPSGARKRFQEHYRGYNKIHHNSLRLHRNRDKMVVEFYPCDTDLQANLLEYFLLYKFGIHLNMRSPNSILYKIEEIEDSAHKLSEKYDINIYNYFDKHYNFEKNKK